MVANTKDNKKKKDIIRRISQDTGMSESSIHKILVDPLNFSKSTVDRVRGEAEKHGLGYGAGSERLSDTAGSTVQPELATEAGQRKVLRIGVIIPSRPLYFWKEAVMGMEKSRSSLEAELDVTVRLVYSYLNFPMEDEEDQRMYDTLNSDHLDGLIIFPVSGEACRRFVEGGEGKDGEGKPIPIVLFNDTQDYMTADWFAAHPHIGYVGPDCYDEGCRAALMAQVGGQDIRRLVVICVRHIIGNQTSETRIQGMCDKLRSLCPQVEISRIELDPIERLAPATLAQRLVGYYETGGVDCIYVSSGVTQIACTAIEKIEHRQGEPLPTFVIGHECAPADRRYLLEGRQRGYIKQDVYTQGGTAVRSVAQACLLGKPMEKRLFSSSVFIR